ncbi:response regulator [Rasiella rasia]|uniref:histidine kinase n=1 Tax=Rasiella rasia TaxID=2744027 RepID=A0A6G6GJN3_9FLAO|nr:response regulator [Rasiella rasia]QIE58785.1 response regulator [Rasiella rasia]
MKKLIFGFLACLSVHIAGAQKLIPDSLKNASVQQKILFLNSAAVQNQLDSSLIYTKKAIEIMYDCTCDSLQLATLYNNAYYLNHIGDYDKAKIQLLQLDSLNEVYNMPIYFYKSIVLKGSIASYLDKNSEALTYNVQAMELSEKMKDTTLMAESYYNLGYLYTWNENRRDAKKYLEKSLKMYQQIGADYTKTFAVYTALREVSENYDEFQNYTEILLNQIKEDDIGSLAYIYVTGSTIIMDNNYDMQRAKNDALKGLEFSRSIQYIPLIKVALYNLGFIENELGNYKEAVSYFEQSLSATETNIRDKILLMNGLSKAHSKLGAYEKAIDYKDDVIRLKDSLYNSKATEEYAAFNAKFNAEQKDKEIAEQQLEIAKQKNNRNNWIFGSVATLLLALGLFQYISFRQKKRKIAIEAELQKEQEVNELRFKFLGNIAHEIRTPLTLISGNLNLALENFSNKEKAERNIKIALENSKKVTEDANEILALLKFEKKKTTINKETTNLDDTLRRMVLSFKSLADMKQLTLDYQSSISATYTTALDLEKTERIVNNLLSNAIKYSPSNSAITVNTKVVQELLYFEVNDQGEGIHYDETEKIFERFYQASTSKAIGGIGIGLSLSREFALLLGGDLGVTSQLNTGSTFTLTLPVPKVGGDVVAEEELPTRTEALVEPLVDTTKGYDKKPKILIAEDNPQMASYLEEILSPQYHCTLAFDGAEALQKVKGETFDLITSDIMMPQMDGFELRASLNEISAAKNIPFILISAKTLEEDKVRGFALGIDDYIVKPFSKNELLARVENLLTHQESRKKYQLQNKDLLNDTQSSDEKLLKEMEGVVLENISDEHFKVAQLAERVHYSQRQLTRIVKQYTGMTPVQFILEVRLQKAYQLLQHRTFFTLSEVRYDVGISSSPYFNKTFKARFGINPSELLS